MNDRINQKSKDNRVKIDLILKQLFFNLMSLSACQGMIPRTSQTLMCLILSRGSCYNTSFDLLGLWLGHFCMFENLPGGSAGSDHILWSRVLINIS